MSLFSLILPEETLRAVDSLIAYPIRKTVELAGEVLGK